MKIEIGDKIVFQQTEDWHYSEEVIIETPPWANQSFRVPDANIWFRDKNGIETNLSEDTFMKHVRCGDIVLPMRRIRPIEFMEPHKFVGR